MDVPSVNASACPFIWTLVRWLAHSWLWMIAFGHQSQDWTFNWRRWQEILGRLFQADVLAQALHTQTLGAAALEARERQLYESTPALLYSVDSRGYLLNASNRLLRKLGYRREDVVGIPVVELMTAESQQLALLKIFPELLSGDFLESVPLQMVSSSGEVLISDIRHS